MKASLMNGEMRLEIVGKEKGGVINYESSNHVTFSSISLLAPGGFGGLGELGVSLD